MTVIVASASEGVMIADTLLVDSEQNVIVGHAAKIVKASSGILAGAWGNAAECSGLLYWVKRGCRGLPNKDLFKDNTGVMLLKPDRTIWVYEGPVPDQYLDDFVAQVALGPRFPIGYN